MRICANDTSIVKHNLYIMVVHLQRHYIYLLRQVNLNLKTLLLIRTYSSQKSGLLMPKESATHASGGAEGTIKQSWQ